MYGMPLSQALVLLAAVVVLLAATRWRPFHPFVALLAIASAFGLIAGFTTAQLGRVFGGGFAEKIYAPGLVILAAAFVAGLAEGSGGSAWLADAFARGRSSRANWTTALFGLIAGLGATPAAAFALLSPLLPALGGSTAHGRRNAALTLALAISAAHGLLLTTPVSIAAVAILGADWHRVLLFGLPLAALLTACGALFAGRLHDDAGVTDVPDRSNAGAGRKSAAAALVLLAATVIPLLLIMVQSLGDIPSEPLGGGSKRELVLGAGRPLILFMVAVGIMLLGRLPASAKRLADGKWTALLLADTVSVLLTVCAAGGLQRICQQTGMGEMLGERMLEWPLSALGVIAPLVVAAALKTLQGSSLVASITTAGMIQPILPALGLSGADGKALAALAIGAGAMTIPHVNDEYFWLVADRAGLAPLRNFAAFSVGTLLQGFIAAAALMAAATLFLHA